MMGEVSYRNVAEKHNDLGHDKLKNSMNTTESQIQTYSSSLMICQKIQKKFQ